MGHEGAKLNNFNAVCLIIVAHEGEKFNEPSSGLTNQPCRHTETSQKIPYKIFKMEPSINVVLWGKKHTD